MNKKIKKLLAAFLTILVLAGMTPAVSMAATTIDVTQTIIWYPDPTAYVIPDVNSRYLTSGDLSNFSNLYLLIARNEIYARHGYIFQDSNISRYFNGKNWYYGTTTSQSVAESSFNQYERDNLSLIISTERQRGSTVNTIPWTDNGTSSGSSSVSSGTSIDVTQTVIWYPDPNAYVLPSVNTRYYGLNEFSNFSNLYLLIARNEIYARHGYIFQDSNIGRYFNGKNWYCGTTTSQSVAESSFNQYEKDNLATIISIEKQRGSTVNTISWTN